MYIHFQYTPYIYIHEDRNILFIVPTRALVQQQANYITKHSAVSACTVQQLCGIEMEQWNALRCVAICCRLLQCLLQPVLQCVLQCVLQSVLQCVLQYVAACIVQHLCGIKMEQWNAARCDAVCCNVLQCLLMCVAACVAMCVSVCCCLLGATAVRH